MIGIYKIENKINSKVYIGSSKYIKKRFSRHSRELLKNTHWNEFLQHDYNIHGAENFTYSLILECNKECLQCNENFFIDMYNSLDRKNGYNIVKNNGSLPEATKKKMSEKLKLVLGTPESRKHISDIMKEKMKDENYKLMMQKKAREVLTRMDLSKTEEQKDKTRGSNNGMAKVKEEDVLSIRKRKSLGERRKNVFKDYEHLITQRGFKAIWLNQNWKHIQL